MVWDFSFLVGTGLGSYGLCGIFKPTALMLWEGVGGAARDGVGLSCRRASAVGASRDSVH